MGLSSVFDYKPINFSSYDSHSAVTQQPFHRNQLYLSGYGRRWGGSLTYTSGVTYASGIFLGGSYGVIKGLIKGGATNRLLMHSLLNSCATHAPPFGNKLAVISLFYCVFSNIHKSCIGNVSTPSTLILGGLSGSLYKLGGSWKQRGLYGATSAVCFGLIDTAFRREWL